MSKVQWETRSGRINFCGGGSDEEHEMEVEDMVGMRIWIQI